MTSTLSIAAQIAADIRAECLPHRMPQHMEARLEAIIDANLAGERAKVDALVKALEIATDEGNTEVDETQEDAETVQAWIARQSESGLRDHIAYRAEQAKLVLLNYRA